MNKRASIGMQYTITLESGDGKQWEWLITDSYFKRRMNKIQEEMLEVIRVHNLDAEFGLQESPEFVQCDFCQATSTRKRKLHRHDCDRPGRPENVTETAHRLHIPPPSKV